MIGDTPFIVDAEEKARALGAVHCAVQMYPMRQTYYPAGYASPGIFAYYYFNMLGDEVGHYIPDIDSFTAFDTPRKWGQEARDAVMFVRFNPQPIH